jgi:hypothetical protein
MDSALKIVDNAAPVTVSDSAFVGSYDTHTVQVSSSGHRLLDNIALGTFYVRAFSGFDQHQPTTFHIEGSSNVVQRNRAAGSDRYGFIARGDPCSSSAPLFSENHSQSSLVALIPREARGGGGCTRIHHFTAAFSWDFGMLNIGGLTTQLELRNASFVNTRNVAVSPQLKGPSAAFEQAFRYFGGAVVGVSDADVCAVSPLLQLRTSCPIMEHMKLFALDARFRQLR